MKKHLFFRRFSAAFVMACLLLTVLCACGKQQTNADGQTIPNGFVAHEAENESYTIYTPQDWLVDTTTGMTIFNMGDEAASNLNVTVIGMSASCRNAAEYFDTFRDQYAQTFTDFTLIDDATPTKLGTQDAYKYTFTATVAGTPYHWMQVLCDYNQAIYVVTYTAKEDSYDRYLENVQSVIDCFVFE